MKPRDFSHARGTRQAALLTLTVVAFSGCSHGPANISLPPATGEQRVFVLKEITAEQGKAFLSELGLGEVTILPDRYALAVAGSASDLHRASVLLDLVDTRSEYVISTIAPVAAAGSVPTNKQIGAALSGVAIGTFANPPAPNERVRVIIDIHGESIVAIIPARLRESLLAFVKHGQGDLKQITLSDPTETQMTAAEGSRNPDPEPNESSNLPAAESVVPTEVLSAQVQPESVGLKAAGIQAKPPMRTPPQSAPASQAVAARQPNAAVGESQPPTESSVQSQARRSSISQGRSSKTIKTTTPMVSYGPPVLANGEDVLQLDLPERLEMIQLLDLAAEYLNLDYMCDLEKIKGQWVSLRLHGKLRGEIRVKDLYPLLESVLKFKGYAMTCHTGGLVTIVPVGDALQVDPVLVDPNSSNIKAGDMVVTHVFKLQHVSAASAAKLLDSMKLSAAALSIEETDTLIVTCYAHRMARIERLLEMVDRSGRPKEFRFRQLQHTMAGTLSKKVEMLVAELQNAPVKISPMEQAVLAIRPPLVPSRRVGESVPPDATDRRTVYLDADEGTNRILMVGYAEQLAIVEEVIEALDVVQQDQRTFKVYEINHVDAEDVRKQLAAFKLIDEEDTKSRTSAPPKPMLPSHRRPRRKRPAPAMRNGSPT